MLNQRSKQFERVGNNEKSEAELNMNEIFELKPRMMVKMLEKASHNLNQNQEYLNQINVFPVADGDTGTNMNHSLKSVLKDLIDHKIDNSDLFNQVAKSAVLNSRGNSGSLLAGFLSGFCQTLAKFENITIGEISKAFQVGYESSKQTVLEPKKGTILDILEVFDQVFKESVNQTDEKNILLVWNKALVKAKLALEKTRNILEKMKKSKVIDAGAAGMYLVLEGFYHGMSETSTNQNPEEDILDQNDIGLTDQNDQEVTQLEFQFCTEFILDVTFELKPVGLIELQQILQKYGDSIQIIKSEQKYKIHIHTNNPEDLALELGKFGKIENFKADDMVEMQDIWHQKHSLNPTFNEVEVKAEEIKHKLLVITDSSADLPLDFELDYPVWKLPIPVFTDLEPNINLQNKFNHVEFYREMHTNPGFTPKTSKINQGVFLQAYEDALKIADQVLVLPISSGMSGSFDSAIRAKEDFGNENIIVLDSQTSSAGLGLKIKYIFEKLSQGTEIDTIINSLIHLRSKLKVYFVTDNVKYMERSGRLSKSKSKIAQFLRLNPLLMLKDGKIEATKDRVFFSSTDKIVKMFYNKILESNQSKAIKDLFIVYAGELGLERANKLVDMIEKQIDFKILKNQILPLTTVVGSHTGPGSIGLIYR